MPRLAARTLAGVQGRGLVGLEVVEGRISVGIAARLAPGRSWPRSARRALRDEPAGRRPSRRRTSPSKKGLGSLVDNPRPSGHRPGHARCDHCAAEDPVRDPAFQVGLDGAQQVVGQRLRPGGRPCRPGRRTCGRATPGTAAWSSRSARRGSSGAIPAIGSVDVVGDGRRRCRPCGSPPRPARPIARASAGSRPRLTTWTLRPRPGPRLLLQRLVDHRPVGVGVVDAEEVIGPRPVPEQVDQVADRPRGVPLGRHQGAVVPLRPAGRPSGSGRTPPSRSTGPC